MKTYNRYITLAAMALTFAACSQDEDFLPQETDSDAVRINATIGTMPQTRLAYGDKDANSQEATTFTEGDQIKVENTKRDAKNIATYKLDADGKTWTIADGALVWNGGTTTSQFQAWYPANEDASYDSFELPTDQSSDALLAAADWMTASTVEMTKSTDGTIDLAFQHLLTKVTVNVTTWNGEYGGKAQAINDARIYSLSTGIEKNDDGVAIDNVGALTGIYPLVDGSSYTAIVCPGKYAGNNQIMTFTVNDEVNEHTVRAGNNTTLITDGLQPGYHYTFNLTVGKEKAEISSVNVTIWDMKDVEGGVADEIIL